MKRILAMLLALTVMLTMTVGIATAEDEMINLTTVKITDSTMSFVDCTVEDNIWHDDVNRDLNIDVTYKWTADITQTDSKFATMIASGDIPDYFNVADAKLAFQLIQDGYCMDITDIYEQNASDALKVRDAAFPEAHDSMKIDGRLFGISELGFGIGNELNLLWIRKDWLAQSGKEAPKTLAELYELAEYFMQNVPGCEYGISMSKDVTGLTEHNALSIMNAHNAYAKIWIKDQNDQIAYGSVQPETKEALADLQDLYARGIISKEFSVKDGDAVSQDVAASKVGIVFGVNWIGWSSLSGTVALDPNATWLPLAVPTLHEGDAPVKLEADWPVGGYWLISKDCKNPEAVIKLFNYYVEHEDAGTFSDDAYNLAGGQWGGSPVYQTNPNLNNTNIAKALETGDTSILTGAEMRNYTHARSYLDGDVYCYGAYAQTGLAPDGAYSIITPIVEAGNYVLTQMRGPMPASYAQSVGTLDAIEDEYFIRIIMGESIDLFDEFVQKWNTSGGQIATTEMNEMYNK